MKTDFTPNTCGDLNEKTGPLTFIETLSVNRLHLNRTRIETLQINIGKLCNQVCKHCHVDAGPTRTEQMEAKTVSRIVELLDRSPEVKTIDITGGAPELNANFKTLVTEARKLGIEVIDRCNLTVFYEKGQETLPDFLSENKVHIIASLPCYSESNVDKQRGRGVFGKSIRALQQLNERGYGRTNGERQLDLVYNPVGDFLPPPQAKLELEYKARLKNDFGIEFDRLFCITNMPIKRFKDDLARQKKLNAYMSLLATNFNTEAAENVMCRSLISIGWDGTIYDCDFNQMLELPLPDSTKTLWNIDSFNAFDNSEIAFADHCYGCTAGGGSSCTGEVARK